MKVVIDPYGDGLRLTGAAYRWLADRIVTRGSESAKAPSLLDFCTPDVEHDEVVIQRHRMNLRVDPDLISALETLGESALGKDCGMRVVDVPDNGLWEIYEVAGFEFIRSIRAASACPLH